MDALYLFIWGALTGLSFACGLFFVRYWQQSRDRFFGYFALAFWSLGATWIVLMLKPRDEYTPYVYLLRLFAFLVILWAIIDKNRRSSKSE